MKRKSSRWTQVVVVIMTIATLIVFAVNAEQSVLIGTLEKSLGSASARLEELRLKTRALSLEVEKLTSSETTTVILTAYDGCLLYASGYYNGTRGSSELTPSYAKSFCEDELIAMSEEDFVKKYSPVR